MSEPTVGDRVRVVLEGEVKDVEPDNFQIGPFGADNVIFPDAEHVVSVEILRPPVKVGDVIETREQLDALPSRTAVVDRYGWVAQRDRVGDGWSYMGGRVRHTDLPATVLYLPDGAA
jgi:hypothetical protein